MPGPLVSGEWLAGELAVPNSEVVVCDVRWSLAGGPSVDAFSERRIAGARFVDLDADLSAPPGPAGRHPLPTPEAFAASMGRLGISNDSMVVAYDDVGGGLAAARMWFMLDAIGVPVAVLDGGLSGWHGAVESGPPAEVIPAHFVASPWPSDSFVDVDDVMSELAAGETLIDARSSERFVGQSPSVDSRPGHIPGALSKPWTENLVDGQMASVSDLARRFADVPGDSIAYCGSGVTACHNLLAMRLAGLDGRLYPGSWSEWSADPGRPAEQG